MNILKLISINSPILMIKALSNNKLAVVDSQNSIRIFRLSDYAVTGGFKTAIKHDRVIGSHVDVTHDGRLFISIIPKSNQAALFDIEKKELLHKIGRHQGEIECAAIDPNGRYCITCGQDGRAFAWIVKTGRLAFSLPPHADFITTVAFNESGQWVATGSFDRTINLLNLATMKNPMKLRGHSSVIIKIIFLMNGRLLSADKEGGLIIWDIHKGKILQRLTKMNDDITTLTISTDKHFLFVGTKLGYIGLYDLISMELLKKNYIKESEKITTISFISDGFYLAVGTVEGNIRIYSLFGEQQEYIQILRERRYKEFYEALVDNPILLYSKAYEAVERIWENVLVKARKCLEKGDRNSAQALLSLFNGIPKKHTLIAQILRDYEKYTQFQGYIENKRFQLAYSMSKQYPAFQDSEPYRKMELRWKKLFSKALELILSKNGDEEVRAILAPYKGISEKSRLIQELFEQRKIYEYFKKSIAKHDFLKFFDLARIYPFLKELPEYTAIINYADTLYIKAHKAYQEGDYNTTIKGCEILISFPDYSKEAQELLDTIKSKRLFYDAITSNNLINSFAYLDSYPLLYDTPEAQILERQWNLIVDGAQRYAAKGLIQEVSKNFEIYYPIKEKHTAMAIVYAQCYTAQLEEKITQKAPQAAIEYGIRRYIEFFGIDDMVTQVVQLLKVNYTTKIDLEVLKKGNLGLWTPSMIIQNIVE